MIIIILKYKLLTHHQQTQFQYFAIVTTRLLLITFSFAAITIDFMSSDYLPNTVKFYTSYIKWKNRKQRPYNAENAEQNILLNNKYGFALAIVLRSVTQDYWILNSPVAFVTIIEAKCIFANVLTTKLSCVIWTFLYTEYL